MAVQGHDECRAQSPAKRAGGGGGGRGGRGGYRVNAGSRRRAGSRVMLRIAVETGSGIRMSIKWLFYRVF